MLKNYFSKEDCSRIIFRNETIAFNKNKVEITKSLDHRLYKFEKYSKYANKFLNDDHLNQLIKNYNVIVKYLNQQFWQVT